MREACKALLIPHALQKAVATCDLMLVKKKRQWIPSWRGGLLDLNTSDAGLPVEADDGVLLCADAVGEVDCRTVR